MNKLTETEKAYIAGLLDGEGCVGIDKSKSKSKKHEFNFRIRAIITNSYFPTMCWLKEKTGIGYAYKYHKGYKNNWNAIHRWQIVGDQARDFLRIIYPYAQIKKELIVLVLQLPKSKHKGHNGRTLEEYNTQHNIYSEAKIKNKRGKG